MKKLNIFFEVDIYNNELLIHPHQTSTQCGIDTKTAEHNRIHN